MSDDAQQEATVNADGSTTFETPPVEDSGAGVDGASEDAGADFDGSEQEGFFDDNTTMPPMDEEAVKGVDPAVYLIIAVVIFAVAYYFFYIRKKAREEDSFFSNLDGDKFNLKLPADVDEYYKVKSKCEEAGWRPGSGPPQGQDANAAGPHRTMAQALMKRAIADIPLVMYIQKESAGMSKLYAKSMCSVNQWRSYQNAEHLVSTEVEEVKAEADEIEPGWSDVIWRQATQYHAMLKKKHEMEAQAAQEKAKQQGVKGSVSKVDEAREKELAAERAAQELIQEEERQNQSSSKGKNKKGGMKKGFLDNKGKKKKK